MTESNSSKVLPAGWRVVRLSDVCEIQLGKMLSPAAKTGLRPKPYLRNVNVQWGRFDLTEIAEMDFDPDEEEKFSLRPGDLLVCEGGEPGRAAVWQGGISPCFYQKALHRLRPVREAVDPAFVMYRLWLGATFQEFGGSHSKTTIAHLPAVRLAQLSIAVPTLKVQQRIVAVLNEAFTSVERARDAAEARLEAARALSGSSLRQVLGTPRGRMWPRVRLAELLAAPLRTGISRPEAPNSSKRCLTLSAVRNGTLDLAASKPSDVSDLEARDNWVLPGAFYVVRGNGNRSLVGRGAVAPHTIESKVLYPDLLIQVVTDTETIVPEYLRFVWDSDEVRRDMESRARTAAGIYKISQGSLAEVKLPLPSITVQREVAVRLQERTVWAKGAQSALGGELQRVNALPAALLRRAFAGEL